MLINIIGPSGSGKTTLINKIAKDIKLNFDIEDKWEIKAYIESVLQQDNDVTEQTTNFLDNKLSGFEQVSFGCMSLPFPVYSNKIYIKRVWLSLDIQSYQDLFYKKYKNRNFTVNLYNRYDFYFKKYFSEKDFLYDYKNYEELLKFLGEKE